MRRSGAARVLAVVVPPLLAMACGGDDGSGAVERADFEARMEEVHDATPAQATCISGYVFDEYDVDEVRTIYENGVSALPLGTWDPYLHTVIACLTAEQLP